MKTRKTDNILFVFNAFASESGAMAGGDIHAVKLIQYLDSLGTGVTVLCSKDFPAVGSLGNSKILNYPSIPFEKYFYRSIFGIFTVFCYRAILTVFMLLGKDYQVVIPTSALFPDVAPLLFLKRKTLSITYLHHIISEQNRTGFYSVVTKRLEKLIFWILKVRKSYIMTVSEKNKITLVQKYGFDKDKIYVTKNGLDLEFIEKIKVQGETHYDMCFCGRIYKTKGIYDLLEVIKIIKKTYLDVKCVLIGDGGERAVYESIIREDGLEKNIILLGYVSEEEKYVVMKSSKVFVLPSHEEGWGIVIGEAMACKVPVVVYKLDDIVDIWADNVSWVRCFDTVDFADKVLELLWDKKKAEEISDKAYRFVQKLNWNSALEKESEMIREIISVGK